MLLISADRIHISERTYYALMQSGKQYQLSKRGQIILKVRERQLDGRPSDRPYCKSHIGLRDVRIRHKSDLTRLNRPQFHLN